jgi:hypothetical protein
VVDEDDLPGAEQPLADHQRADHVIGDDAARVADDVRVASGQAKRAVDVEPGVHAGDDREVQRGVRGRGGARERARVLPITGEKVIDHSEIRSGGRHRARSGLGGDTGQEPHSL